MKYLFWKEWRENRWLPLGSGLLAVVLMAADWVYVSITADGGWLSGEVFLMFWLLGSGLIAAIASASTIAGELSNDGLLFVTSLPISRPRIWWIKLAAACCTVIVSMFASGLLYLAGLHRLGGSLGQAIESVPWRSFLWSTVFVFGIGMTVSALFDRTVSATVATILVSLSLIAFIMWWPAQIGLSEPLMDKLSFAQYGIWPVLSLFLSYVLFTRGETLRTSKRIKLVLKYGLGAGMAVYVLIIATSILLFI
jgi:ABC-type transport system involved in multi-copper enzyme maturation permease subunit